MPNAPFDPYAQLESQTEQDAGVAIYSAATVSPERAATVQKYADALGLPPETVDRNFDQVKRQADTEAARDALKDKPATMNWLANPFNAQVANDQLLPLSRTEAMIADLKVRSGQAAIGPIRRPRPSFSSIVAGLLTSGKTGLQEAQAGGELAAADAFHMDELGRGAARRFGDAQFLNEARTPEFNSRTGLALYGGVSSLIQTAPAVGLSVLARNPAPALAVMGAQTGGQAYGKYRERGATPGEAALGAGGEAAVEVGTELLPMGFLANRLGRAGFGELITNFLGRELPGEQVATFAQDAIDTAIHNPDMTWEQFWKDRPGAAYDTLVATGVSTLALGGVHAAFERAGHIEQQTDQAHNAIAGHDKMDQLVEELKASPMPTRAPQQFEELLGAAFGGEHVYVPAESVQTYLQDLKPEDQQAFIDATGIADQLGTELPAGADIVIPAGKYFTHVAPSDAHTHFAADLRLGVDGMSRAEAEAFEADKNDLITKEGERLTEEAKQAEDSDAPGRLVYADAFRQFREAGYTIDAARAQATLWAHRYETRAARFPERYGDALAAYKASNPSVVAAVGEQLAPRIDRLDLVADELRRSRSGTEQKRGPSLIPWLAKTGGLVDAEGDLAGMDAGNAHKGKPGQRRLINPEGRTLEDAAISAWEHGYLPGDEAPGPGDLLDTIRRELAGAPTHAVPLDERKADFARAVEQLDALLGRLGIDPAKASNAEIKAAVQGYAEEVGGTTLEQPAYANNRGFVDHRGHFLSRQRALAYALENDLIDPRYRGVAESSRYLISEWLKPDTMSQEARGSITFGNGRALIKLFSGRDLSTLLHEGGHLWLDELEQDAAAQDAPDQVREDFAAIKAWAGLKLDESLTVEAHEKFARGIEAYMREGRAPAASLRGAFQRFAAWLTKIYRKVEQLNVRLSPEVRDVFARLIATDEEIASAQEAQGLNPIFAEKPKTTTAAEFNAYTRAAQAAQAAAHDKLLNKALSTLRRERTKEWRDEWSRTRDEEASIIDTRRDVRALHFLSTGLEIGEEGEPQRVQMDRDAIVDMMGTDTVLARLPQTNPRPYAKGGVDPHLIAARFGYDHAEPMINDLMTLEGVRKAMREAGDRRSVREKLTDDATEQTMRERHGDPLTDGSLEEEALDAVNGDARAAMIGAEIRLLAREAGQPDERWSRAGLKEWAERQIMARKASEVRPATYLRAERKFGNEAQRLLLKGKPAEALAAKWRQLANLHLYRAARDAAEKVDKATRSFSRIASTRTLKSTDQDYLDQAHNLLIRFGFKELRLGEADKGDFDAWVDARAQDGELILPPPATDAKGDAMTVADLLQLRASIENIMFLGREQQTVYIAGQQVLLEHVVQEAVAAAATLKDRELGQPWNPERSNLRDFDASLLTVETWVDWLDGGDKSGPWNRALIWGASDAHAEANDLYRAVADKLREQYLAVPKEERAAWSKPVDAPELPNPVNPRAVMSKAELLAVALNTGNESNLNKLVEGYGWTEAGLKAALDRNMTEADWRYVQGVWDTLESLWPRIAEAERALVGVEPDRIIVRPVQTPFGEFRGGYYPVVYDRKNDPQARARQVNEEQLLNDIMVRTSTGRVHERGNYTGPILLDVEQVLTSEINKRIQRIAYGQYVLGARRFIVRKEIAQVIRQKLGDEYYDQLVPWLRRQIGARIIDPRGAAFYSKFLRRARMHATVVGMGFRISTIASQLTGLGSSAAEIGEKWVAVGVGIHLKNPAASMEFAFSRSRELKSRLEESSRDVRDALGELARKPGQFAGLDDVRRAALYGIGWTDLNVVAVPTWRGAYEKAREAGVPEADAIREADKAVRKSQGAGMTYAISAIQDPSNEVMRLFTMFYSWMNTSYNRQRDAIHAGARGDFAEVFHKSFWYVAALPVMAALLGGQGPDDGESWAEWALRTMALNISGGVPVLRDAASYAYAKVSGHGFASYSVTPLARGVESVVASAVDLAKLVGEGEAPSKWVKHTVELPGWVFGLPTGQLATTSQFLWDVMDGDEDPADAKEWIKGLMTGRPN